MKRKHLFVLAILLSLCLSGCSKHEEILQSSDSFGVVEESSSLVESSEGKEVIKG